MRSCTEARSVVPANWSSASCRPVAMAAWRRVCRGRAPMKTSLVAGAGAGAAIRSCGRALGRLSQQDLTPRRTVAHTTESFQHTVIRPPPPFSGRLYASLTQRRAIERLQGSVRLEASRARSKSSGTASSCSCSSCTASCTSSWSLHSCRTLFSRSCTSFCQRCLRICHRAAVQQR